MLAKELGKLIVPRDVQFLKAELLILVKASHADRSNIDKPVQSENAEVEILPNAVHFEKSIEVNPVHLLNALEPIVSSDVGRTNLESLLQL